MRMMLEGSRPTTSANRMVTLTTCGKRQIYFYSFSILRAQREARMKYNQRKGTLFTQYGSMSALFNEINKVSKFDTVSSTDSQCTTKR